MSAICLVLDPSTRLAVVLLGKANIYLYLVALFTGKTQMVNRHLIRQFDVSEEDFEQEWSQALEADMAADLETLYSERGTEFSVGQILRGTVLRIEGSEVLVDVGYKSEGLVPLKEWTEESEEEPQTGDEIEVLLDDLEDNSGLVRLSKRKAARIRGWERIIGNHAEGDVVTGNVIRKIKGGLLLDIGVNVFLPASQVDIRRPGDIGDFIGRGIQAKILKIDETRRNIVVSRRKLIEEQRNEMKKHLLADLDQGQRRRGDVKNIADFGAFVEYSPLSGDCAKSRRCGAAQRSRSDRILSSNDSWCWG